MSEQLLKAMELLKERPLPEDVYGAVRELMEEAPDEERRDFSMIFEGLDLITRELTAEEIEVET